MIQLKQLLGCSSKEEHGLSGSMLFKKMNSAISFLVQVRVLTERAALHVLYMA